MYLKLQSGKANFPQTYLLLIYPYLTFQTNADNALQDKLNYLKDLTLRIKKDAQAIESSLGTSVADFDHAVKNGFHEGQKGVSGVYDRAMKHLESVPEECVRGVKDNLLQLQSAADRTFLSVI